MKIENLVEKDTVLDNDYLIVDGTDGTKKAKKSTFLSELNSRYLLSDVKTMRFQVTSDKRVLIWFYTDTENNNGFRIDFMTEPKEIQFRSIKSGSSELIGSVQMQLPGL